MAYASFHSKSPTFVDDALFHIHQNHNLSVDHEYHDLVENCTRSIAVLAEFQQMILQRSQQMLTNKTRSSVLNGYVSHYITEVISARGYIEELERKILEDIPAFPQDGLLIPQFDALYPNLQGIRNTLEHNAERRRGLKAGRKPIQNIQPLIKPDGTTAKCGELVIIQPSTIKCHLSDGTVGEVDLESMTAYVCKLVTETVKRFPPK